MTAYNTNFNHTYPFSDLTIQIALAANTALSYTVPGTAVDIYRAEFSYSNDSNVWIGYNIAATVPPAGAITTVSNRSLELNPGRYSGARYVKGGDVLSFISNAVVGSMGISLLKLPSQNN